MPMLILLFQQALKMVWQKDSIVKKIQVNT